MNEENWDMQKQDKKPAALEQRKICETGIGKNCFSLNKCLFVKTSDSLLPNLKKQ